MRRCARLIEASENPTQLLECLSRISVTIVMSECMVFSVLFSCNIYFSFEYSVFLFVARDFRLDFVTFIGAIVKCRTQSYPNITWQQCVGTSTCA